MRQPQLKNIVEHLGYVGFKRNIDLISRHTTKHGIGPQSLFAGGLAEIFYLLCGATIINNITLIQLFAFEQRTEIYQRNSNKHCNSNNIGNKFFVIKIIVIFKYNANYQ